MSGDKRRVSNYRGVTPLSAGSKVFEILMGNEMFRAAKMYNSPDQDGFTRTDQRQQASFSSPRYSCKLLRRVFKWILLYTNLKSAFDRVNHLS